MRWRPELNFLTPAPRVNVGPVDESHESLRLKVGLAIPCHTYQAHALQSRVARALHHVPWQAVTTLAFQDELHIADHVGAPSKHPCRRGNCPRFLTSTSLMPRPKECLYKALPGPQQNVMVGIDLSPLPSTRMLQQKGIHSGFVPTSAHGSWYMSLKINISTKHQWCHCVLVWVAPRFFQQVRTRSHTARR